jgi:SAM-dependent methyltransferase
MEQSAFAEMARTDEVHWWFKARRRIIASVITRYLPLQSNARIFEVGCGTGSNLTFLSAFGQLTGIEPDQGARAFATARCTVPVIEGFLPDGLPIADKSADMIVMLDVLEHIDGDLAALKAIASKLKPGARLLVTVPALPGLWSHHDQEHHHKRRYTAKTLQHVITESGLELEKLSYFNTLLFPIIAGVRALKAAFGNSEPDTGVPSPWLNSTLAAIFGLERFLIGRIPMPIGVSLIMIARKKAA